MAITIVVEDGTGIEGANAWESVANTATRIADLGFTGFASLTSAQQTAAVYRGTQRLDGELATALVSGGKTERTQGLSYPRRNCYLDGIVIDTDEIPEVLLDAAAMAAVDVGAELAEGDPSPLPSGIKEESEGGATVEYAAESGNGSGLNATAERRLLVRRLTTRPFR
jgi:hypothetical protein